MTFATGSTVTISNNTAVESATAGGGIYNDTFSGATVTFDTGSDVSITGNTPNDCEGTTICP